MKFYNNGMTQYIFMRISGEKNIAKNKWQKNLWYEINKNNQRIIKKIIKYINKNINKNKNKKKNKTENIK